jgi:hypothetical protein
VTFVNRGATKFFCNLLAAMADSAWALSEKDQKKFADFFEPFGAKHPFCFDDSRDAFPAVSEKLTNV